MGGWGGGGCLTALTHDLLASQVANVKRVLPSMSLAIQANQTLEQLEDWQHFRLKVSEEESR